MMRTTINMPEDIHRAAMAIARDRGTTLNEAVAELVRRGLRAPDGFAVRRGLRASDGFDDEVSERTGLPVIRLGTAITSDDLRALDDD